MKSGYGLRAWAVLLVAVLAGASCAPQAPETASPPPVSSARQVVVYTPFPDLTVDELAEGFTRKTGLHVEQIREGTARVFARLRAEKNYPRADVWCGGGGMIPFMTAAGEGLLEPYVPTGHEDMPRERGNLILRDRDWRWVGIGVISLGFAYNPQNLSPDQVPRTWEELATPRWRGHVEMWDPAESGTSMLFLESALLRALNAGQGEEAGWDYLTRVFGNLKRYTREGAPSFAVARGQSLIGIHFEFQFLEFLAMQAGNTQVADASANIRWYLPPSSPVLAEGIALVRGGPNPEAGKAFIDYCLSEEGQRIINRFFFSVDPSIPPPAGLEGVSLPDLLDKAMKLDPEWMAANYDRVRRIWQNRVEATAEE